MANALRKMGIKSGDSVIIYMAMTIECIVAMQTCARIGAIHSVVFGSFSTQALRDRIMDVGAVAVICRRSIPRRQSFAIESDC